MNTTTEHTIDQRLKELRFLLVIGTLETVRGKKQLVGEGTPFSWASNQGVLVIYDQYGRPWIKRSRDVEGQVWATLTENESGHYKCGAYVPHSQDHFAFINTPS